MHKRVRQHFRRKQTVIHMSLTAGGTVARSDSSEWVLPVKPAAGGGAKCTTVTMLLAQRIARNDCWSVDDEPCYRSNKMNVWQTLEYLSGLSLRKRYNYEGFSDTQNLIFGENTIIDFGLHMGNK